MPEAGHATGNHRVCSGQEEAVLGSRRAPSRTETKWAVLLLLLPARQPSTGGGRLTETAVSSGSKSEGGLRGKKEAPSPVSMQTYGVNPGTDRQAAGEDHLCAGGALTDQGGGAG